MSQNFFSKMEKIIFFKITPERDILLSKRPRMSPDVLRHVFDDLEPIEKISSKNFFDSKNGQDPLFAPIYRENPRKKRILGHVS